MKRTANRKCPVALINQGSLSGLKVATILVPESNEDPFDVPRYEVLSVSEQSSKVEVFGRIKVGDQLTTRVKGVKFYAQLRGFPIIDELVQLLPHRRQHSQVSNSI